ncbi:MAG: flagellar basal body rod protein FlgC [Acidobacteriota bacterium]
MSGLFSAMDVSASAMTAQRQRLNLLITNMANAQTTRTPEGGPYKRKDLVFATQPVRPFWEIFAELEGEGVLQGVRVQEIVTDTAPPILRYDPAHPDADAQGLVAYPNVKPLEEMANLMSAIRSFEINVRAFQAVKQIVQQSIELGRA